MDCLTVNQILDLFRDGLLTNEGLIKAYNIINYKVVSENINIDSLDVWGDFVEAVRGIDGIPTQVNMGEEVLGTSRDDQVWGTAENSSMITEQEQQQQLGSGPSVQQETGPSKFTHINIIDESNTKFIKKFNTTCKSLRFTFNDEACKDNPLTWLQSAFEELHACIVRDAVPSDRVGITLRNPNFPDKPIGLSFRRVDQLSVGAALPVLVIYRHYGYFEMHLAGNFDQW